MRMGIPMAELRHHFTEITCPDTGRPIMVALSTRDDPVGSLYVTNQISRHQYGAALAYLEDVEASTGQLRATSRGPEDAHWRGRRSDGDGQRRHRDRLARAHSLLGPARTKLIKSVLIDGSAPRGAGIREFALALDELAISYGMATPTSH